MAQAMAIFEKKDFGQIRTVTYGNGDIWFVAKDVADALGYSATGAMSKLIDDSDKILSKFQNGTTNVNQLLINESGLYDAIFGSTMPNAKAFKKWVTSEVLPSIRKTGKYSVESTPVKYRKKERIYGHPDRYNLPVTTFTSREFGQVRIAHINGVPFFVAKDVLQILGHFKNQSAVVLNSCDDNTKIVIHNKSVPPSNIIVMSLGDIHTLVEKTDTQFSLDFLKWIETEVLIYFDKFSENSTLSIDTVCSAVISHLKEFGIKNA